jgi:hypothetical protein
MIPAQMPNVGESSSRSQLFRLVMDAHGNQGLGVILGVL